MEMRLWKVLYPLLRKLLTEVVKPRQIYAKLREFETPRKWGRGQTTPSRPLAFASVPESAGAPLRPRLYIPDQTAAAPLWPTLTI
jgi:hypothetical protein